MTEAEKAAIALVLNHGSSCNWEDLNAARQALVAERMPSDAKVKVQRAYRELLVARQLFRDFMRSLAIPDGFDVSPWKREVDAEFGD
jgi:hypothetical protein